MVVWCGTDTAYGAVWCGTEIAYAAMRCGVLRWRMARPGGGGRSRYQGRVLSTRYALSGTDIVYDATRYAVLSSRTLLCGTDIAHAATRCAVLTWRMLLRDIQY
eukprot:863279-Rhodomonas_salina.2